jgi:hypothetical protein
VDVDAEDHRAEASDELEIELRLLDRMLGDATAQLERIRDLINQTKAERQGGK